MTSKVLGIDLRDAGRDGLYRVVPDDPPTLIADAQRAGLRLIEVDADDVRDDAAMRARLARAFALRGEAADWDALAAGLRDLGWMPAPGYVLLLNHAAALRAAAPDVFQRLHAQLERLTRDWHARGVPFFVFMTFPDNETLNAAIDA